MEPESDKNQRSVNMSKLQPLQCKTIVFRVPGHLKMNKKIDEKTVSKKRVKKTSFFALGWALWRTFASKDPKMVYFRSPLGTLKTIKNHQKVIKKTTPKIKIKFEKSNFWYFQPVSLAPTPPKSIK